jgi:hypothetical protein
MADRVFKLMGSHSATERAKDDFYQSSPEIANALFECVKTGIKGNKVYATGLENTVIIDSSVGTGVLLEPFKKVCWYFIGYDIADRGYEKVRVQDWLTVQPGDEAKEIWYFRHPKIIVQNPPFKLALEFVQHGLELLNKGELLFSLHRIQFLETRERFAKLYGNKQKPKYVFVFANRVTCVAPDVPNKGQGAMCYAWFMWQKGFRGNTQIKWIIDGRIA